METKLKALNEENLRLHRDLATLKLEKDSLLKMLDNQKTMFISTMDDLATLRSKLAAKEIKWWEL
jgi:hypothetical protein